MSTGPQLEALLADLPKPPMIVVLDFSDLTFIDSTALRVLLSEHRRARAEGYEFVIAGAAGPVREGLPDHRLRHHPAAGARRRRGDRRLAPPRRPVRAARSRTAAGGHSKRCPCPRWSAPSAQRPSTSPTRDTSWSPTRASTAPPTPTGSRWRSRRS
ncbi:STAS domain-containing protein [Baekduia alba]|uniref:STAS domain-containing protein n=1 Tax=Baekduia alba TaxID=2997333 RepID=UPI0032C44EED